MGEGLAQYLIHIVLVSLEQRADAQRGVSAQTRYVLASLHRVSLGLVRLAAQPPNDRDAVVAEYHEAVVQIAHQARELELQDAIQGTDDLLGLAGGDRRAHGDTPAEASR